jgi:hypothetical protein
LTGIIAFIAIQLPRPVKSRSRWHLRLFGFGSRLRRLGWRLLLRLGWDNRPGRGLCIQAFRTGE